MMALLIVAVPILARAEAPIGHVAFVKGTANIQHVSSSASPAKFGDDVFQMDTIETKDGEVKILFVDKTMLILGANSKVLITEHVYAPKAGIRKSLFSIVKGTVRTIVDQAMKLKENDVRLQTATAVAGIRGTDAGVQAQARTARFVCFNGAFEAFAKSNPADAVMVRTGEWTEISGPTPTRPAAITPDVMRQFGNVVEGDSLKDILRQAGAETISALPAAATPTQTPASSQPAPETPGSTPQSPQQEQPPQPQYLPGGNTNTPSDASGSSGVSVPLTFPSQ
jgi:hypothetical protein